MLIQRSAKREHMTIEERMNELNEKVFALRAELQKMGPHWGGPSGEVAFMQARLQVLIRGVVPDAGSATLEMGSMLRRAQAVRSFPPARGRRGHGRNWGSFSGANSYQSALRGEACNKVLHRTLGGFEQVEGRMRRLIYQLRLPPSTSQGGVVRGRARGGCQWAAEARAAWWSGGVWGSAGWRRRASKGEGQRAAAAGEPGCRLKGSEPEKPRSRNCPEPRRSRQGVFIHGRKELR